MHDHCEHRSGATGYAREQTTGRVSPRAADRRLMLVDFRGVEEVMAERAGVSAVRPFRREIIAPPAATACTGRDRENYIATRACSSTSADRHRSGLRRLDREHVFRDRRRRQWEEPSFAVNGSKWGADRPAFPLLQPEKVLTLPLQLRFDEGYRYRLAGTERVDDFDRYVVLRSRARGQRALHGHGVDRQEVLSRASACRLSGRAPGAGRLQRGNTAPPRRWRSATARRSCSAN
jgi:hypothetical protein